MASSKKRIVVVTLIALLASGPATFTVDGVAVAQYTEAEAQDGFNDEYLFATTKSVNNMEGVNPALKLTLYPVTIVLDAVFLPFAVVAGYVA